MNINETVKGFRVTDIRSVDGGRFVMMTHEKSGARLGWMDNGAENKVFSISFKTVPWDDTGVFHILEHTVLCGSDKYPVKEPFLDLLKGSMNTFLNAMTYPDKTVFPVASRNDRDFMNLTKIYLDAVFKPAIYTEPNIFYQEGHHIEWTGEDSEPVYKGVVFNEMKGADSVYERIEDELYDLLFPDTCYRFVSGGAPAAIPDLTYEEFLAAHKRFYHPSNSYIYLDGAVDIDEVLTLLEEYLCEYDAITDLPEIPMQETVAPAVSEAYYEISAEEDEDMQTFIAVGKMMCSWDEREKGYACAVLCEVLTGSNDSPFKRAILDTGLCLDVTLDLYDGIAQNFGVLKLCNTNKENGEALLAAVKENAEKLVKNGLGREAVLAAVDRIEFRFRSMGEPKGINRAIAAMASWLYGGDPLYFIEVGDLFDRLRESAETDYFERLLQEWLLDETGRVTTYVLPSHTCGDEERAAEKMRLEREMAAMSEEEKATLIELNRKLAQWQSTPDSPEAKATLPTLPLSEISDRGMEFITETDDDTDYTLLHHPAKNKDIDNINLYFNISDFTNEELLAVTILDRVILDVPTASSTGEVLQRRIMGTLGSLGTDTLSFCKIDCHGECLLTFNVSSRYLCRNSEAAQKLIGEILTEAVFEDKALIKELLKQCDEDMKQGFISGGQRYAVRRARCNMSSEAAFNELTCGYENYKYVRGLLEDDEKLDEVIKMLPALAKRIFCRSRLIASITSTEKKNLDTIVNMLPEGEPSAIERRTVELDASGSLGLIVPSGVSYSAAVPQVYNTESPVWAVLSNILSYEYLWNEVRVQGGAYGTGCRTDISGVTSFHSFRDPSPDRSIGKFTSAADFIEAYCGEKPDISSYIISTIASMDPLISDAPYGNNADTSYFVGLTNERRAADRRAVLEMTADKLLEAASALRVPAYCCVIGTKEAVELCGDKLDAIEIL